jgi:phage protein D
VGLTDWKPAYRVTVDGQDITSILASRLVSLRLTDAAGVESDSVEIVLSDHLPLARLEIPPTGAEIRVALGYAFGAKDMGLFIADSVEAEGPPDQLRIRGTASVHGETTGGKTALTEQKTRSWDAGTTIATLVETIAGEHGLEPGVSDSLAGVALPHLDQIDESDISLLTRVAREYDAIAKPGGGRLVMAARGESLTVAGQPMPAVALTPAQVSRWRLRRSLRAPAGQVVALYRDQDAAEDVEVTAGDGEPVQRLRRRYPDEASAQEAANAEFRRSARAGTQLSVDLPGDPDLVAEGRVALTGFRPGVNGEWLVTRVVHALDAGGYRCSALCEPPEAAGVQSA